MQKMRKRLIVFKVGVMAGICLSASVLWADPMEVPQDLSLDESLSVFSATAPVVLSTEPVQVSTVPVVVSTETPAGIFPLKIVHPPEGATLPYLRTSFAYGSADPRGTLSINGKAVPIHPGGGFLAMVSFTTGTFVIQAELRVGTATHTASRKIFVSGPPVASPVVPLTIETLRPEGDMELRPGDPISIFCKGSPGMEAFFQIEGVHGKFPLLENSKDAPVRGIYRGTYILQPEDKIKNAQVRVTLVDRERGEKAGKGTRGRVSRMDEEIPRMVEVTGENAVVRAGPAYAAGDKAGYLFFPPVGTRLQVVGRQGEELKVRLSQTRNAWITQSDVRVLPKGTHLASTTAGSLAAVSRENSTLIRVPLGQKIPFEVRPADDRRSVDVSFFGAVSNSDWIHYDSSATAVAQVRWFQDDSDTYRVRVVAPSGTWWGYDARYEGATFVLELRSPPVLKSTSPLEGLTVAVDAGHSSDKGSVGPTGLLEKDANLAIALVLQKKLLAEKARVVMIRKGNEHVSLYDRPKMAWQARADVLISVHNNALPEGANPFERNGYGVYYFHPYSLELARDIHGAYADVFKSTSPAQAAVLRDDSLHYGNLALPRTPQMPAVLTESAYMIVPREEALLKTEAFQDACAEAMLKGLKRYVRRMRGMEEEAVMQKPAGQKKGPAGRAPVTGGKGAPKPSKGESPKKPRRLPGATPLAVPEWH
ncbi:MAG: N-acetylmuramoyl-L-alanine amidase [Elusimicrobia bacterium]|nr:N-acetylmuramoyl-L-alanine amidase [Elusimicrobiota bacterium]